MFANGLAPVGNAGNDSLLNPMSLKDDLPKPI